MLPEFLSNEWIVIYGGLAFTVMIVFTETAFPIGAIIPGGELLLFISGLLAGSKWIEVSILFMVIPITLAAFIGNLTGYSVGFKLGDKLIEKRNKLYFRKKYFNRTIRFNDKFKSYSLFLGHFFPVIRTFNPLLHGSKQYDFQKYFVFSGIGCIIYVNSLIIAGYFVGDFFPYLKDYAEYIIAAVLLFIFITPILFLIRKGVSGKQPKASK